MKRIYHHYSKWEDFLNGMWGYTEINISNISLAANHLRNPQEFKKSCLDVINNWHNACEHNLTNGSLNQIAWLGQAAVLFKHKISEQVVRVAWNTLSPEEQDRANFIAEDVITQWRLRRNGQEISHQECLSSY